jgi:hypothetical protein
MATSDAFCRGRRNDPREGRQNRRWGNGSKPGERRRTACRGLG